MSKYRHSPVRVVDGCGMYDYDRGGEMTLEENRLLGITESAKY